MPVFSYKARNNLGDLVSGLLESPSEDDLLKKLRALNYMPVHISLQREARENIFLKRIASRRVKGQDIVMLNLKLAYMTNAGIPLLNAIRIMAGQVENLFLRSVLLSVSQKVFEGAPLSKSMADFQEIFSPMYISMIKVGEASGTLHVVLNRMAAYIEQEENLKQKIKAALFYPMILVVAGFLVTALIIIFVIPQFVKIFTQADVPLPLPTLILHRLGLFCRTSWPLIVVFVGGSVVLVRKILKTDYGKNFFDRHILGVAYIGDLMKQVYVARLCRALGILLESGVSVLESLDIVRGVVGNNVYKRIISQIGQNVKKGEKISYQLKDSGLFPGDAASMIATGEETGKLGPMLHKIADFYEMVMDNAVKKLTMLIEPILILFIGSLIGVVMASVILPMFDMVKTIQG